MAILTNVFIRDLLTVLNKLASQYEMVDITIDVETRQVLITPVKRETDDTDLSDDNIYTLI